MKVTSAVIVGSMLVMSGSVVYAQGGAQASSSASSSTSVQADKSGASASSNNSGSTSAHAGQRSASLASGTAMNAALSQPVDAKKNKPGDQVTAKTTEATKSEGKVVIPKGSKLIGHVTECKQRSKEEKESALGIVFDKAVLKNGEEIPLNVSIRALAAAQSATSSSIGGDDHGNQYRSQCWRSRGRRSQLRGERRWRNARSSRRLECCRPAHLQQPGRVRPRWTEPELSGFQQHARFADYINKQERASR